jgi:hypothetical protein
VVEPVRSLSRPKTQVKVYNPNKTLAPKSTHSSLPNLSPLHRSKTHSQTTMFSPSPASLSLLSLTSVITRQRGLGIGGPRAPAGLIGDAHR